MTSRDVARKALRPVLDEALLLGDVADGELVLVRHAQQSFNHLKDPSRPRAGDAPLSELGERQADTVGDALASEHVDVVYTSHLLRAHETARRIAARHGLTPVVDERLREVGIYEQIPRGRTVLDELGEEALEDLQRRFATTRRWDEFPFSESSASIVDRGMAAIDDVVLAHPTARRIVVVCHTGLINSIIARVIGSTMDALLYPAHASLSRLARGDGRLVVRTLNEHHYHHCAQSEVTY